MMFSMRMDNHLVTIFALINANFVRWKLKLLLCFSNKYIKFVIRFIGIFSAKFFDFAMKVLVIIILMAN